MSEDAPNRLYCVARKAFAERRLSWIDDVFWIALFSADYVPNTITDLTYAGLSPNARLLDAGPIGFRSVDDEGYCRAGPISVQSATTAAAATQIVIYRKDPLVATNEIPVVLITQMGGLPVQLRNDFFRLDFGTPTDGVFDNRVFRV